MKSKKRIAIDMDEVIAELMPSFIDIYEREMGWRPTREQYWGKKLYELPDVMKIRQFIFEKGFFRNLPVMANSQEVMQDLQKNYDLYIVTAAMEFRNSFEDKYDWLAEHFPFIHWKNIVFCGDKSIIQADYLIDDLPKNLETFQGKSLLYTASHNTDETHFTRVNNWLEIKAFFDDLDS